MTTGALGRGPGCPVCFWDLRASASSALPAGCARLPRLREVSRAVHSHPLPLLAAHSPCPSCPVAKTHCQVQRPLLRLKSSRPGLGCRRWWGAWPALTALASIPSSDPQNSSPGFSLSTRCPSQLALLRTPAPQAPLWVHRLPPRGGPRTCSPPACRPLRGLDPHQPWPLLQPPFPLLFLSFQSS